MPPSGPTESLVHSNRPPAALPSSFHSWWGDVVQEVLPVVAVVPRDLVVNDLVIATRRVEDVLDDGVVLRRRTVARLAGAVREQRRVHHPVGLADHLAVEFRAGLKARVAVLDDRGDVLH